MTQNYDQEKTLYTNPPAKNFYDEQGYLFLHIVEGHPEQTHNVYAHIPRYALLDENRWTLINDDTGKPVPYETKGHHIQIDQHGNATIKESEYIEMQEYASSYTLKWKTPTTWFKTKQALKQLAATVKQCLTP